MVICGAKPGLVPASVAGLSLQPLQWSSNLKSSPYITVSAWAISCGPDSQVNRNTLSERSLWWLRDYLPGPEGESPIALCEADGVQDTAVIEGYVDWSLE